MRATGEDYTGAFFSSITRQELPWGLKAHHKSDLLRVEKLRNDDASGRENVMKHFWGLVSVIIEMVPSRTSAVISCRAAISHEEAITATIENDPWPSSSQRDQHLHTKWPSYVTPSEISSLDCHAASRSALSHPVVLLLRPIIGKSCATPYITSFAGRPRCQIAASASPGFSADIPTSGISYMRIFKSFQCDFFYLAPIYVKWLHLKKLQNSDSVYKIRLRSQRRKKDHLWGI